jgi:hypothetical protein
MFILLLTWSNRLQARGSDPFGDVNIYKYQGNMTITVQVQQNGSVVTDATVAIYCEDELRGKERVGSGTNPNLSYLTVFGEYTGHYDYLYFKVYTNGIIFTVTPSPAIPFSFNGSIGTESEPYIITLPVSLTNNADNSTVLTTFNSQICDVVLAGRTFYKDGHWNTICLPFNVPLDGSVLEGAVARPLSKASLTGSTLNLTFGDAVSSLVAGTPYIIRWERGIDYQNDDAHNIVSPLFTGVTLSSERHDYDTDVVNSDEDSDNDVITDERIRFLGIYGSITFDVEDKSILFMGASNTLYYPQTGAVIGAQRAYFKIGEDGGTPAPIRTFVFNFGEEEATSIQNSKFKIQNEDGTVYDLTGRKFNVQYSTPKGSRANSENKVAMFNGLKKGIYIVNGKKILK